MSRLYYVGANLHLVRGTPRGVRESTHHFDRAERHRLVREDREARATVLLVLAGAMAAGLATMLVTLIGYV
jgi:hypothetical protein